MSFGMCMQNMFFAKANGSFLQTLEILQTANSMKPQGLIRWALMLMQVYVLVYNSAVAKVFYITCKCFVVALVGLE